MTAYFPRLELPVIPENSSKIFTQICRIFNLMEFVEHHRRGCLAPPFSCSEEDPEAMEAKSAIIHRFPGAVCEARGRRTSARTDGDELTAAGGQRRTEGSGEGTRSVAP